MPIDEKKLYLGPFCIWFVSVNFFENGIRNWPIIQVSLQKIERVTHRWRNKLKTQRPRVPIPFVPWLVEWHWARSLITWWLHFLVHNMWHDGTNLPCWIVIKIQFNICHVYVFQLHTASRATWFGASWKHENGSFSYCISTRFTGMFCSFLHKFSQFHSVSCLLNNTTLLTESHAVSTLKINAPHHLPNNENKCPEWIHRKDPGKL